MKEADRLQSLMDRLLTPHRLPQPAPLNVHEVLERVRSLILAEFPTASRIRATTTRACRRSRATRSSSSRRCSTSRATPRRRCRAAAQGEIRAAHARRAPGDARAQALPPRARDRRSTTTAPASRPSCASGSSIRWCRGAKAAAGWGSRSRRTSSASTTARSSSRARPGSTCFTILLPLEPDCTCPCREATSHDHRIGSRMKPVWIIDDDRSIRWVFEKALAREDIAFKTFASAQRSARRARRRDAAGGGERHPHAGRVGPRAAAEGEGALPATCRSSS